MHLHYHTGKKIECLSILGHENYEKRFYHANAMSSLSIIFICLYIYISVFSFYQFISPFLSLCMCTWVRERLNACAHTHTYTRSPFANAQRHVRTSWRRLQPWPYLVSVEQQKPLTLDMTPKFALDMQRKSDEGIPPCSHKCILLVCSVLMAVIITSRLSPPQLPLLATSTTSPTHFCDYCCCLPCRSSVFSFFTVFLFVCFFVF